MSTDENECHPRTPGWPPLRALCVDDNHDCADSLAMLLKAMGVESCACYDGRHALSLNPIFRPGICFIDLNMPGMDGDEVAKRLLSQPNLCPLLMVAMTARSDEESRARTAAAGFDLHFVKPVDLCKIGDAVDALFEAAARKGRFLEEPVTYASRGESRTAMSQGLAG